MSLIAYGLIGTDNTTLCMTEEIGRSLGSSWVKLNSKKPNDGKAYVVTLKGDWISSSETFNIQSQRRDRIVSEWPYYRQLEAIMDHMSGDTTKVDEFIKFKQQLREVMPYMVEESPITPEENKAVVIGKGKK